MASILLILGVGLGVGVFMAGLASLLCRGGGFSSRRHTLRSGGGRPARRTAGRHSGMGPRRF